MDSFYQDNHIELYDKDCRQMTELADNSVQCVVTSPPYWGLRKYSGEQELIWGNNHCEHQWQSIPPRRSRKETDVVDMASKEATNASAIDLPNTNTCSLCGAWKGAYGLEPTPEMYVQHTIEILREIRRVVRKDGVCFWNIGDSYATSHAEVATLDSEKGWTSATALIDMKDRGRTSTKGHPVLKPKDLCLIPFRIAIAAQEDGWWVRSVIIWSKPNPMPESVTDRPTESHEYILMLTKSAKYYWDADAVREQQLPQSIARMTRSHFTDYDPHYPNQPAQKLHFGEKLSEEEDDNLGGRNIRTVWEFPTQPYPEAHFAVFPEKLPELCIKAATPEVGCCSKCGRPWGRITKVSRSNESYWGKQGLSPSDVKGIGKYGDATANDGDRKRVGSDIRLGPTVSVETIGWQPTCKCNSDKVPSLVLDPFAGAGTTLWVAKKLNRRAVGYEISEEYCELALERNRQQVML